MMNFNQIMLLNIILLGVAICQINPPRLPPIRAIEGDPMGKPEVDPNFASQIAQDSEPLNEPIEALSITRANCNRRGMTWGWNYHLCSHAIDSVGCSGTPPSPLPGGACNAYSGDTQCSQRRPILCIKKKSLNRPPYPVFCQRHAMPKEAYCGWTGAFLGLTPPIQGCALTSLARGDFYCRRYLGCGYRMAEFHDGKYIIGMSSSLHFQCTWNWSVALTGGWAFHGYSNLKNIGGLIQQTMSRFWVHINDQNANCWN